MNRTNGPTSRHSAPVSYIGQSPGQPPGNPVSSVAQAAIRAPAVSVETGSSSLAGTRCRIFVDQTTRGMGLLNGVKLAAAMMRISPEKRDEVAFEAPKLFKEGMDPQSKTAIIEILGNIPLDNIFDVVNGARQLITQTMRGKETVEIVRALSAIPLDRIPNIVSGAKELITDTMNGEERVRIVEAVAKISNNIIPTVVFGAKELMIETMSVAERVQVVRILSSVSPDEMSNVVLGVKELITDRMGPSERVEVVAALAEIRPDQISWLVRMAGRVSKEMSGGCIALLIRVLANIPNEEASDVVDLAPEVLLVLGAGALSDMDRLVQVIHKIPLDERSDVIVRSIELITAEGIKGPAPSCIFSSISGVSPDQRDDVIRQARKLNTKEMGCFAVGEVISAIAKIPTAGDRSDVIGRIGAFISKEQISSRGGEVAREVSRLVRAISRVNRDQRDSVMQQATGLFDDQWSSGWSNIVDSLAKIPTDRERVDVVGLLRRVISNRGGSLRHQLLDAIIAIDPDDRLDVVHRSLDLISDEMSCFVRCEIIKAVAQINPNNRRRVIEAASRVIDREMSGRDIGVIVRIFGYIEPNEWDDLLGLARQIVPEPLEDTIQVVETLAKIPSRQREKFTQWALSFISNGMRNNKKSKEIASLIEGVPIKFLNNFTHLVTELIPKEWTIADKSILLKVIKLIVSKESENKIDTKNKSDLIAHLRELIQQGVGAPKIDEMIHLAIRTDLSQRASLIELLRRFSVDHLKAIVESTVGCPPSRVAPVILAALQGLGPNIHDLGWEALAAPIRDAVAIEQVNAAAERLMELFDSRPPASLKQDFFRSA